MGTIEARKAMTKLDKFQNKIKMYLFAIEIKNLTVMKCRVIVWGTELTTKMKKLVNTRDVVALGNIFFNSII